MKRRLWGDEGESWWDKNSGQSGRFISSIQCKKKLSGGWGNHWCDQAWPILRRRLVGGFSDTTQHVIILVCVWYSTRACWAYKFPWIHNPPFFSLPQCYTAPVGHPQQTWWQLSCPQVLLLFMPVAFLCIDATSCLWFLNLSTRSPHPMPIGALQGNQLLCYCWLGQQAASCIVKDIRSSVESMIQVCFGLAKCASD